MDEGGSSNVHRSIATKKMLEALRRTDTPAESRQLISAEFGNIARTNGAVVIGCICYTEKPINLLAS